MSVISHILGYASNGLPQDYHKITIINYYEIVQVKLSLLPFLTFIGLSLDLV